MKTAARLWGYPEDETESSFDPLVNVLFSATALELEKISNEIHAYLNQQNCVFSDT